MLYSDFFYSIPNELINEQFYYYSINEDTQWTNDKPHVIYGDVSQHWATDFEAPQWGKNSKARNQEQHATNGNEDEGEGEGHPPQQHAPAVKAEQKAQIELQERPPITRHAPPIKVVHGN